MNMHTNMHNGGVTGSTPENPSSGPVTENPSNSASSGRVELPTNGLGKQRDDASRSGNPSDMHSGHAQPGDVAARMTDPIAELVEAARTGGKPSLAWVVRWSADGRDPVAAAWEASTDGLAMIRFAMHCRIQNLTDAMKRATFGNHNFSGRPYTREQQQVDANDIRASWTPPALAELLGSKP